MDYCCLDNAGACNIVAITGSLWLLRTREREGGGVETVREAARILEAGKTFILTGKSQIGDINYSNGSTLRLLAISRV